MNAEIVTTLMPHLACDELTCLLASCPPLWRVRDHFAGLWDRSRPVTIRAPFLFGVAREVHVDLDSCTVSDLRQLQNLRKPVKATACGPERALAVMEMIAANGLDNALNRLKYRLMSRSHYLEAASRDKLDVIRLFHANRRYIPQTHDLINAMNRFGSAAARLITELVPGLPLNVLAMYGDPMACLERPDVDSTTLAIMVQRHEWAAAMALVRRGIPCRADLAHKFGEHGREDEIYELRAAGVDMAMVVIGAIRGRQFSLAKKLVADGFPHSSWLAGDAAKHGHTELVMTLLGPDPRPGDVARAMRRAIEGEHYAAATALNPLCLKCSVSKDVLPQLLVGGWLDMLEVHACELAGRGPEVYYDPNLVHAVVRLLQAGMPAAAQLAVSHGSLETHFWLLLTATQGGSASTVEHLIKLGCEVQNPNIIAEARSKPETLQVVMRQVWKQQGRRVPKGAVFVASPDGSIVLR